MSKGAATRDRIVAAAAKLFRRAGYAGTALQDIFDAGKAPRGSIYFHFPKGKEEIGEAALRRAGEAVRTAIAGAAATSNSAATFLIRIARGMAADLEASDFTEGCPIATTALEMTDQSETLRAAARDAFQSWEDALAAGLARFAPPETDTRRLALAALSQLEGALLLARTRRGLAPMVEAEAVLRMMVEGVSRDTG